MACCHSAFRSAGGDGFQRFPGSQGPRAALKLSNRHGFQQHGSHCGRYVCHTRSQARCPPSVNECHQTMRSSGHQWCKPYKNELNLRNSRAASTAFVPASRLGLSAPFFKSGWGDLGVVTFEETESLLKGWPPEHFDTKVGANQHLTRDCRCFQEIMIGPSAGFV